MKKFSGILALLFASCSPAPQPQALVDQFRNNREVFEACRKAAYNDPALTGNIDDYVVASKLSESLSREVSLLSTRGLAFARLHTPACDTKEYDMELVFEGDQHLEYKACGDVGVSKGVHSEDGSIEYWGLDDKWYAWINHASGKKN